MGICKSISRIAPALDSIKTSIDDLKTELKSSINDLKRSVNSLEKETKEVLDEVRGNPLNQLTIPMGKNRGALQNSLLEDLNGRPRNRDDN